MGGSIKIDAKKSPNEAECVLIAIFSPRQTLIKLIVQGGKTWPEVYIIKLRWLKVYHIGRPVSN